MQIKLLIITFNLMCNYENHNGSKFSMLNTLIMNL